MSIYSQNQIIPDIFKGPQTANANSIPIFASDFKTALLDIVVDAAAAFDIRIYRSDQYDLDTLIPPDISKPQSVTNQYEEVQYTAPDGTSYGVTAPPFNPAAPGVETTYNFNIESVGARWYVVAITGYAAGTLLRADITLFSNFI